MRARDVQLLFADASTGARSPALVRQGQIGEIIAAKPQARRLILEEAAGISGLHSRRHEAELRLKGAEDNLLRVEDVLKQIDVQVESLKRQARQSSRYRNLAADIRNNEALAHLHRLAGGRDRLRRGGEKLDADLLDVAERTRAQGEAARLQALAAADLPGLREEEARRGAALQRMTLARDALEAKRSAPASAGRSRAPRRPARPRPRARAGADRRRGLGDRAARGRGRDAGRALDRRGASAPRRRARKTSCRRALPPPRRCSPRRRPPPQTSTRAAHALGAAAAEEGRRLARLEAEYAGIERELQTLRADGFEDAEHERRAEAAAELAEALEAAEQATLFAEEKHAEARDAEALTREPLAEAERKAQALETEARTLAGASRRRAPTTASPRWSTRSASRAATRRRWAPRSATTSTRRSTRPRPPTGRCCRGVGADPSLPDGVESLAPMSRPRRPWRAVSRRSGSSRGSDGERLAASLEVGQRLVSREGDLWRWDGFVAAAEAPTPAARRLVEKNRLGDLEREAEAARRGGRYCARGSGAGRRSAATGRRLRGRMAQPRPRRPRRLRCGARARSANSSGSARRS